MGDFLIGFLSCGVMSLTVISLYIKHKKREEARLKQTIAVEILRNLNVAKLRQLLGDMDVPAWITHSDFERAEWLSHLLGQVWPYLDNAVSAAARAKLEPKLRERRAAWMADISVEHFTLGSRAPMCTGVKLYRNAAGGVSDTASMDIDFLWSGNQDVSLVIKPLPYFLNIALGLAEFINIQVGVERVIVSGRVRVLFKPLLDTLPIIGAVQVAFADMPSFRFDLRLLGGDVTSLPFLEDWLQNVFCSSLENYTLPNKVALEVVKGILAQVERPEGILKVKLIEATNIPKTDFCTESDPYVVIYIRPHRRLQSTIQSNHRHPVWNKAFRLLVHERDQDTLTCLLYDYDHVRADTLVGRVDLPVAQIDPGQERDLWLEVQPPHCATSRAGSPDRPPGSPPGQSYHNAPRRRETKRVSAVRRAREVRERLLRSNKPCRLHLKVHYEEIDPEALRAAVATDDDASEAEDETEAAAVARNLAEPPHQAPQRSSRSATRPDQAVEQSPRSPAAAPDQARDPKGGAGQRERRAAPDAAAGGPGSRAKSEGSSNHRRSVTEKQLQQVSAGEDGGGEGSGQAEEERERRRESRRRRESQEVEELREVLTGGILVVQVKSVSDLVGKPWWKGGFKTELQVRVTVCGYTESSSAVRPPRLICGSRQETVVMRQEVDFELTGEEARRLDETIQVEIWDMFLVNEFQGSVNVLLSDVVTGRRLRGEWPLSEVTKGTVSLDLSWTGAMQRGHIAYSQQQAA